MLLFHALGMCCQAKASMADGMCTSCSTAMQCALAAGGECRSCSWARAGAAAALPLIVALDVDVAPAPQHPSRSQSRCLRTAAPPSPSGRTCTENGAVASVPERSMLRSDEASREMDAAGVTRWTAAALCLDPSLQHRDCSGGWSAGVCLQQHPIIPHCVRLYGLALSCCKTLQLAVAVGYYGCTVNETAVCTKQNNALSKKQCCWAWSVAVLRALMHAAFPRP